MLTNEQFAAKLREVALPGVAREVSQACMSALDEQLHLLSADFISKLQSLLTTYEFEYRLGSFGVYLCICSEGKEGVTPDVSFLAAGTDAVQCISDTLDKAKQEKILC